MLYYYKHINEGGKVHMSEYVFKNVNQIGEREYQTVINGQELAQMWRDGIITYNPEIQRGTKVKRGKGKGYTIVNNNESRKTFANKIEKMFKKLLNEKTA